MDLSAIQATLRERNIDGWLFYDHHHRDPIAYRVLGLPEELMVTRRWFYLIPANGEPLKLVHKIEAGHLDSLPGNKMLYSGWQELFEQIKTHYEARDLLDSITAEAFKEIGRRVRNGGTREHDIQKWFMEAFERENLVTDDPPIVAVNANSGNPHYEPGPAHSAPIREGDFVLLDVWAKKSVPGSVYYDITWTGFVGKAPSDRQRQIFEVVRGARDAGVKTVKTAIAEGRKMAGWEVDRATRDHINQAGFGQQSIH